MLADRGRAEAELGGQLGGGPGEGQGGQQRGPGPAHQGAERVGLVGAAFMLAWAADAGECVFSGGLVLATVALVTVLPELVIEVRFAYIQATELVTANLTGATRLLLTGATVLPLLVALLARRRGEAVPPILLGPNRRVELGVLLVAALFAVQIGSLTPVSFGLLVSITALAVIILGGMGSIPGVIAGTAG